MNSNGNRRTADSLLAKLQVGERANLRVYIGAAPGVGKTFQMLEDAHLLKKEGVDIVVAIVETHGREDTRALIGDLSICDFVRHPELSLPCLSRLFLLGILIPPAFRASQIKATGPRTSTRRLRASCT